ALAGVCDGSMRVGPLLAAIAELLGEDPLAVRERAPQSLRTLISEGFIQVTRLPRALAFPRFTFRSVVPADLHSSSVSARRRGVSDGSRNTAASKWRRSQAPARQHTARARPSTVAACTTSSSTYHSSFRPSTVSSWWWK